MPKNILSCQVAWLPHLFTTFHKLFSEAGISKKPGSFKDAKFVNILAPEVVVITIFALAGNDKVGTMTTFGRQILFESLNNKYNLTFLPLKCGSIVRS